MALSYTIRSGQKQLRCGYTTGTCAALAAAGAAFWLLTGQKPADLSLMTPKGIPVQVEPACLRREGEAAVCGVRKDGGDDIDATHGLIIEAHVEKSERPGVFIEGGRGVGRVTKPGLDQPVGAAAINRVPRQMIEKEVTKVQKNCGYMGGLSVTIVIPGGEEAAKKTFNPHLGIEGGLSVLGTSGIVEPMSEQALIDTIEVEIRQAAASGHDALILTPGHYGELFLQQDASFLTEKRPVVKCSNFIGDALDLAALYKFRQVLLVGHMGKLIKLAGGIMNTHSRYADGRMELICAHAAVCGASRDICRTLMQAATTDACLELLESTGLRDAVLQSLLMAIDRHLSRRAQGAFQVGAMLFSNVYGLLGQTEQAKEIITSWQ